MSEEWDTAIVKDLCRLNNNELSLSEFVNKHWIRFKPVYISVHKYIDSDGDVYFLVYNFFSRILRADVQPLFQSDNQLFRYFKTAVKNNKYDIEHKKEVVAVAFTDLYDLNNNCPQDPIEDKIPDENSCFEDNVLGEIRVNYIFNELSKRLAEPYIQLLVLLYKGYTPKESRKELGVSLTTVRDRIGVIRKVLKEDLKILPPK